MPQGKSNTPEFTLGELQEVYETVSGGPVSVEILETVKRGGSRCRFEVKLLSA